MAKREGANLKMTSGIDTSFGGKERMRENCYVHGEADLEYGMVSGFRQGITSTEMRTGDGHGTKARLRLPHGKHIPGK